MPDRRMGETYVQGEERAGEDKDVQLQTADTTSAVSKEGMVTISTSECDNMLSTMKALRTEKKVLLSHHNKVFCALQIFSQKVDNMEKS